MRSAYAAVLVAVALAAPDSHGDPVAFVADIRGNATIEGDGRLTFLAELPAGSRLLLGSHAAASITYASSGAEFTLTGPGQFLVTSQEVTAERGAKPLRRRVTTLSSHGVVAQAAQTATASLRMRGIVPAPPPPALEFPVATRVSTLRPALRWRGAPGEEYVVAVRDETGRELWKGRGKGEGTRPAMSLGAAARYSWTVSGPQGTLGQAQFETLPAQVIGRAEKSRAHANTFPDRVVHALLLQEIGAEQEARDAWAELARERPDLPELPALAR